MGNVEIVRRSYVAFAAGDLDAVMGDMHPAIAWHQAQGLPHGGLYHGLAEVRRNVFEPLDAEWWAEFSAEPDEFLDAGDRVVVLGRYRGVAKETGKPLGAPRRARGRVSAVPRHRGLGRGALDLIIDTAAPRSEDRSLSAKPPANRAVPPGKEDT